jgi:hypothetical protein
MGEGGGGAQRKRGGGALGAVVGLGCQEVTEVEEVTEVVGCEWWGWEELLLVCTPARVEEVVGKSVEGAAAAKCGR